MAGQRRTRRFDGKTFRLNLGGLTKDEATQRATNLRTLARVQRTTVNVRVTRAGRGNWQVWVR
ncbi:hypothetical protein LCGC14_0567630 [marine sediment metagenome]|uniref:Uncharacterized protein n=1 Tax=marine sediment metagenome TaxID=412755 RepID=A0A0F9RK34_9ZZZZ